MIRLGDVGFGVCFVNIWSHFSLICSCCLSHFTTAVVRHHNQGNLLTNVFGVHSFEELVHDHHPSSQQTGHAAGRQAGRQVSSG